VSSWIESMVDISASWAVLTAKHGCGFLLYDTNTTLPDGTPYPYKVPANLQVMRQFVDAATAAGIGTGFYYSLTNNFFLNVLGHSVRPPSTLLPGQANVTQDEFEALAIAQMQEIWTAFGPLTEVWLDGGCGDLCDKVAALVKQTLAADAVAFNGGGGTSANAVRWCGTEGGAPAFGPGGAVWSTANCSWCPDGSGSGCPPDSPNAAFYPSGVDVTLQVRRGGGGGGGGGLSRLPHPPPRRGRADPLASRDFYRAGGPFLATDMASCARRHGS
jgi:alpha-L-fucosidase